MLKTYKELVAAGITDTATSNVSYVQGQDWTSSIIHFGEDLRRFDQCAVIANIADGDNKYTFPLVTGAQSVTTSSTEGDTRTNTEMTDISYKTVTINAEHFKRGLYTVSKQILKTSRVDLAKLARYKIANALARDVDQDIRNALMSPNVTNVVYGGNATAAATLENGDIFTTDVIAKSMRQLELNNFTPRYLYVNPYQMEAIRQDAQFMSAAQWGSQEVIKGGWLRGQEARYAGLSIIMSTNVQNRAAAETDVNAVSDAYAVAGTCCIMVGEHPTDGKCAVGLAWKEKPAIGYIYEPDEAVHKFFYDQAYRCTELQVSAISLLKVSQA